MKSATATLIAVGYVAFLCVGCEELDSQRELQLDKQLATSQAREKQLAGQVEKLVAQTANQKKQIRTLQTLSPNRLKKLFVVDRIELSRYTGGVDTNKKPGHDAIKVMIKPLDKAGSVIKSAGAMKIQLFDLADKPDKRLLAEYNYPVEKIGKHWAGGFMANHYSFMCSWKKPPANQKITVRVEFIDHLTGKTFTTQKLVVLALPPKQ